MKIKNIEFIRQDLGGRDILGALRYLCQKELPGNLVYQIFRLERRVAEITEDIEKSYLNLTMNNKALVANDPQLKDFLAMDNDVDFMPILFSQLKIDRIRPEILRQLEFFIKEK